MAYLVPENLPSRSNVPSAVQEVAGALRDFVGDDVTVWLDERTDGSSHLAVLDPAFGVLLIRVVEGGVRALGTPGGLLRRKESVAVSELIAGVAEIGVTLRQLLDASKHLARTVPVVTAAAAPGVSRSKADSLGYDRGEVDGMLLEDDFPRERLGPAIQRVLGQGAIRLDEPEERAVRAVLRPDIVIHDLIEEDDGGLVFRPPEGSTPETVLAVLDREQENLARYLGDGYRVIKGVAGSGKTLVLSYRVRFMAEERPEAKILLTCFNTVLAKALQAELADVSNVEVRNVDSLAYSLARTTSAKSGKGSKKADDFEQQRRNAIALLEGNPARRVYDLVVVDEAQDLGESGLRLAYTALRPERGDFIVALDAAQNIYRKTPWTPPGTSGRGRTKVLRVNYRNTREILEVAHDFLVAGASEESPDGEVDDPAVIIPPEASARRGERPKVVWVGDVKKAVEAICADMLKAHGAGARWDQMAVLFGSWKIKGEMYHAANRHGIPYHDVAFDKKNAVTAGDKVRGATFQLLKGLEFRRVYLYGVDSVEAGPDAEEETKRRLIYVGMTRATDHLMIALYENGPMSQSISAAAR